MSHGIVNTAQMLSTEAFNGAEDRFVRAFIYDSDGTFIVHKNLTHIARGLYMGTWTPAQVGQITVVTIFYTDDTYGTEDTDFQREGYALFVGNDPIFASCHMTTTFISETDVQEVLCWLDINGQTQPDTENARIVVTDGEDLVIWTGQANIPDSRGVFRISKSEICSLIGLKDRNYAMTITINHNETDYTTTQPFYTVR